MWACFLVLQPLQWQPFQGDNHVSNTCFFSVRPFRNTFVTHKGFAAGFSYMWDGNLRSFLKLKFRTAIGSHFWDLLQKVLQQILVFQHTGRGNWEELKNRQKIKRHSLLSMKPLLERRGGAGPSHIAKGWQHLLLGILASQPITYLLSMYCSILLFMCEIKQLNALSFSYFSHEKKCMSTFYNM